MRSNSFFATEAALIKSVTIVKRNYALNGIIRLCFTFGTMRESRSFKNKIREGHLC